MEGCRWEGQNVQLKEVQRLMKKNQQDATLLYLLISTDALHVSGGSSAHHQEHITIRTASGTGAIVNEMRGSSISSTTAESSNIG